jgi:23S rRNA pseudouridine955/2504/2580 synthase
MDALEAAIVFEDARLLAPEQAPPVASHGGSGISSVPSKLCARCAPETLSWSTGWTGHWTC